jgi:hypothetical protein
LALDRELVMKLAIVLARQHDLGVALALTAAALRANDAVRWFVMADGVAALAALPALDDVEVVACATSSDRLGLVLPAWITLGSQDDHAAVLDWADRTVALT